MTTDPTDPATIDPQVFCPQTGVRKTGLVRQMTVNNGGAACGLTLRSLSEGVGRALRIRRAEPNQCTVK